MSCRTIIIAVMVVLVSASTLTIKRTYHDRDGYDIYENGRRSGVIKRDYYDADAYSIYKRGKRQGTVKRDYYSCGSYRHQPATVDE